MRIRQVTVKNFRSILDETLELDSLTALVGRNGAGKSTFLSAIDLFYDPSQSVTAVDFYAEEVDRQITVSITYDNLNQLEEAEFSRYVENDTLTVILVVSHDSPKPSLKYHGVTRQHSRFARVRAAGSKQAILNEYRALLHDENYSSLPRARSSDDAMNHMAAWELNNPDECVRQPDDGQFFGYTQVGQGRLARHTRFVRVPAVHDAKDDIAEKRGSPITEIMDLLVRNTLAKDGAVAELRQRTSTEYESIMEASRVQLDSLEMNLSQTLRTYAPDAGVSVSWAPLTEIVLPRPQADVRLAEDGYTAPVEQTGHGLQRAFILTMLQHLAATRSAGIDEGADSGQTTDDAGAADPAPALPDLLLAIEEPELYQHPTRQRHFASVLRDLADAVIPGVAARTQVIYTTHSPLFVGLDRFNQIRVLRKMSNGEGRPRVTQVASTNVKAVADTLHDAVGANSPPFTADSLVARLQAVMTPWVNEGFFADVVVLVEGGTDYAAIAGTAKALGLDFDSAGIAVIPCGGKENLDRPAVIFRQLRIPVYVVWDSDYGHKDREDPAPNRRLLRILGKPEEDWPSFVDDTSAALKINLENTLKTEIDPDLFQRLLSEAKEEFGVPKNKEALKRAKVVERIIADARVQGSICGTLSDIVERVMALKNASGRDHT